MSVLPLPQLHWGNPEAARRALLVHGLGSNAASNWRLGEALAASGWWAVAVDLRGHGLAPRSEHYRIADYAGDLAAVHPGPSRSWDLVLGHSLGAASAVYASVVSAGTVSASAVSASAAEPPWTKQLVLLDPAFYLTDAGRTRLLRAQIAALADQRPTRWRAKHPLWDLRDLESKLAALAQQDVRCPVRTTEQNNPWNVLPEVEQLSVPTLILGSDPEVGTLFSLRQEQRVTDANPLVEVRRIPHSSHSIHRDQGEATVQALLAALPPESHD